MCSTAPRPLPPRRPPTVRTGRRAPRGRPSSVPPPPCPAEAPRGRAAGTSRSPGSPTWTR
ncbi:hypothetical protein CG740_00840 [Streptomyces sp. CB01201]|nr:hypothetical protein CG740_00840 [Streptomyces sp. CB01201]